MRSADVLEVAAVSGASPLGALLASVEGADRSFCAVFDGEPECIFGVSFQGGLGAEVWLLGTDEVKRHTRHMLVETRRILEGWLDCFPVLHNFVADDNVLAKRFLKATGFTLAEHITTSYGIAGLPFRYFWRTAGV